MFLCYCISGDLDNVQVVMFALLVSGDGSIVSLYCFFLQASLCIPVLVFKARKFAVLYSIGSVLFLGRLVAEASWFFFVSYVLMADTQEVSCT